MEAPQPNNRTASRTDVLGLGSSLLCLLHCLAVPVLVGFFSAVPGNNWHQLDYLFLALALVAAVGTTRRTHDAPVMMLLWGGFALFALGMLIENWLPDFPAYVLHGPGSIIMIVGHVRSLRVGTCQVAAHGHS